MASAKFEREYSQHLVEQVLKGKMTRRQMLVRASVFGLSLTAAGQLLAACGGDDGGTAASPSASGAPEPVMGGTLKLHRPGADHRPRPGHHLRPGRHRPRHPVPRVPHRPQQRQLAAGPSSPRAGRRTTRSTSGRSSCARASRSTTAAPSRPRTWSRASSASSIPRAAPAAPSPQLGRRALARRHQGDRRPTPSSSPSTSRSPTSRTRCPPATTTPPSCRAPTRATSSRTRSAPAPSCSISTCPSRRPRSRRTPPTGARTTQGQPAPVPGRSRVHHGRGQLGRRTCSCSPAPSTVQPQTVFQGAQALFQDPNLRVDIYPGTGIREVAFNQTKEPWKTRRRSSSARPSPTASTATPSTRRCTTAAATSASTPSGTPTVFPGSPTCRPSAPRTTTRPSSSSPRPACPDGLEIELTVAKYLENPQLAQLIQDQCKPAGINVKINQMSYDEFYAGSDADYYGTTPWIVAPMTIVEWGSRPTPGIYAAAMLLPDAVWSSSHWDNPDFAEHLRRSTRRPSTRRSARSSRRSCRRSSRTTRRSWCRSSSPRRARRRRTCTASRARARSTATAPRPSRPREVTATDRRQRLT